MVSFDNERALFSQEDRSVIRLAQRGRRPPRAYRAPSEIEGRAADHLEHVGSGSLLLKRFGEIAVRCRTSSNSRTFSMAIAA